MDLSIPILTTRETNKLRLDYPSIEHLEAGNIAIWLQERQDQLLIRAKEERAGMNLAKFITLGSTAVGAICYATSPLAPIGAVMAGIGYAWSIVQDVADTHQFAPIPFIRGNIFEFLSAMGDSEAREEWFSNQNELADLMLHLEPMEKYEFVMLKQSSHVIAEYLGRVDAGKKFYAYRWLLDWFIQLKGQFPTSEQLHSHLANVDLDPRINYQQVTAIQEVRNSNTQIGIPAAKFAQLPNPVSISLPSANNEIIPQEVTVKPVKTEFETINHLSIKIQNSFIVGLPGSGKDFLVSHATRQIKQNNPNACLFLIDCKNDEKEYGYYTHFDHIERIPNWECDSYEFVTWFKKAYRKYEDVARQCEKEGRNCLVIINEGTRTGMAFSEEKDPFIKSKIATLTSSGDSRGRNIWIMVQAPQLTDLGFGDNVRSQLLTIAILHESNIGAIGNWWKTNILGKQLKQEQLLGLISDSPRKRIVYSGQTMKWYPMPELPNYSGYDRDKRQFLPNYQRQITKEREVNDNHVATQPKTEKLSELNKKLIEMLDSLPAGYEALNQKFMLDGNEEHKQMIIKNIKLIGRLDLLEKFELD